MLSFFFLFFLHSIVVLFVMVRYGFPNCALNTVYPTYFNVRCVNTVF